MSKFNARALDNRSFDAFGGLWLKQLFETKDSFWNAGSWSGSDVDDWNVLYHDSYSVDSKSGAIFLQRNKLVGIEKFAHVDTPLRRSDGELSSADGTAIEYDDADWLYDSNELAAIEEGLSGLGVNNMPGLTVFFMGTADNIFETAWSNRDVYAKTESEKPVDSKLIKTQQDYKGALEKLEVRKVDLTSTLETVKDIAAAAGPIKEKIAALDVEIENVKVSIANIAEKINVASAPNKDVVDLYIRAARDFFFKNLNDDVFDARNASKDGIAFLLRGIAPLAIDEVAMSGAMSLLGNDSGDADFATLLNAAWYFNRATDTISKSESQTAVKAARSDLNKLYVLMRDVSESRLDNRQQGLLFRFVRMVGKLNALIKSLENSCVDNTILKDGACVECPEDMTANDAHLACDETKQSCASKGEEFKDGTPPVCKPCESDEKFNSKKMVCEDKPKVVYRKKSKSKKSKPVVNEPLPKSQPKSQPKEKPKKKRKRVNPFAS